VAREATRATRGNSEEKRRRHRDTSRAAARAAAEAWRRMASGHHGLDAPCPGWQRSRQAHRCCRPRRRQSRAAAADAAAGVVAREAGTCLDATVRPSSLRRPVRRAVGLLRRTAGRRGMHSHAGCPARPIPARPARPARPSHAPPAGHASRLVVAERPSRATVAAAGLPSHATAAAARPARSSMAPERMIRRRPSACAARHSPGMRHQHQRRRRTHRVSRRRAPPAASTGVSRETPLCAMTTRSLPRSPLHHAR